MRAKRFDWGVIISPTSFKGNTNSWSGYIDDKYLFNGVLTKTELTDLIESVMGKQEEFTAADTPKQCFIVLDDIYGSYRLDLPIFVKLAAAGRQFNITTFMAVHEFTDELPMIIRENAGYIYIFKSMITDTNVRSIYDMYLSTSFPDWRALKQFLTKNCENFGVVCINNQSPTTKGTIYCMRAPTGQGRFKIQF